MGGCGDNAESLRWEFDFADPSDAERAVVVDATVLQGGCAGERIAEFEVTRDTTPGGPQSLSPGRYGLAGTARDSDCMEHASGCTEIDFPPSNSSPVVVPLAAVRPEVPTCDASACVNGRCSAATLDAGPEPDADVEVDAGTASACDDEFAGAIFCDGFEDTALGAWTPRPPDGATVDGSTALTYAGRQSLSIQSSDAGDTAEIFATPRSLAGVSAGTLYTRLYVYLPSGGSAGRASLVALRERAAPRGYVALSLDQGRVTVLSDPQDIGDERTTMADTPLPRDRWTCVQLEVALAQEDQGTIRIAVDGTLTGESTRITTQPVTQFEDVEVGILTITPPDPVDVYLDELVVDVVPIPCD